MASESCQDESKRMEKIQNSSDSDKQEAAMLNYSELEHLQKQIMVTSGGKNSFLMEQIHSNTSSEGLEITDDSDLYVPPRANSLDDDELPLMFQNAQEGDDVAKIFACHICNFKTAFKNSLVNHQAVHSDVRPWVCEACGYAAKRKHDLKKHLHCIHGMMVDSLSLRPCVNVPSDFKPESTTVSPNSQVGGVVNRSLSPNLSLPLPLNRSLIPLGERFPFRLPSMMVRQSTGNFDRVSASSSDMVDVTGTSPPELILSPSHQLTANMQSNKYSLHEGYSKDLQEGCKSLPSFDDMVSGEQLFLSKFNLEDNHHVHMAKSQEKTIRVKREQLDTDFVASTATVHRRRSAIDYCTERNAQQQTDSVSNKIMRFQHISTSSESSALVTSQTEHIASTEALSSSTVMRTQAVETAKSFHCTHCDILFFENALFLMHATLHDKVNPWKCAICGQTFAEKYSFTSHFINQH